MPLNNNLPRTISDLNKPLPQLDITAGIQLDSQHPYPIGCGVTAEVYRGSYTWTHPETLQVFVTKVAIKQLVGSNGEDARKLDERVRREVANWQGLKHPNVTQFLGVANINPGRPLCLVSQYVLRNNLLEYIGRHPDMKFSTAREIACGVHYLHSNCIVHGDICVDNVLVTDAGVAQINDFGMSRIWNVQGFTTKIFHNIRFTAPELIPIKEEPSDVHPTSQSDIFSLGILFLQLFNGHEEDLQKSLPYNHVHHRNTNAYDLGLLRRIHDGERPIRERYAPMSDHHWELLCWCWHSDPSIRPDINQVLNVL